MENKKWLVRIPGMFFSRALYTEHGCYPSTIDEAIEAADHTCGEYGWEEVYNGYEGYQNPNV